MECGRQEARPARRFEPGGAQDSEDQHAGEQQQADGSGAARRVPEKRVAHRFQTPISWLATLTTVLLGIAKPMPAPPEAPRVGIPTTWPARFVSAPPLLPGLMGALVWTRPLRVTDRDSGMSRLSALTSPWVTEPESPYGLPMASTISPT